MTEYRIIAAIDDQYGYAKAGEIPWYSPADFKHFKSTTLGYPCVMGRKTYEDINKRLGTRAEHSVLPGRKCYVLSRQLDSLHNATVVNAITDLPTDNPVVYVIGGGALFDEFIELASEVIITLIPGEYGCDSFFPHEQLHAQYEIVNTDQQDGLIFITYRRK